MAGRLREEAKNTIRYRKEANGKSPAMGTLYLQKWLLGKEPPQAPMLTSQDAKPAAGIWD